GTWTWSAEGSYRWYWVQELRPTVHWFTRCREIVNTPPVAQASVEPYLAPVGSDFTFDGSASSDEDGTIVSWDWDFGDGNAGTGITTTHAYEFAGLYNATLTVTDDRGAESTDSVMAVVYDPAAGFATGGGWFIPGGKTSYDNDYLPNIDGTSPANFGFVVKYKKGATTPDGQLEFQYQQGDFNLHSSGMEWLVITNKNWAKFQGLATIKGLDGLYPFHVDARDGDFGGRDQPDRFIIKVYPAGGDPDEDELIYKASGDLEGGNIVIHGKGYEVTTLRLQSCYQPDDPLMTPLENFAQAVEQGTEGSVRIELYSTAAPVMPADAVKWGDVEMGLMYTGQ
ncbi:MAG: PKD domain-containing protein, partial [Dehalococcoidia bacterium]|nr:PKD domain-containing protein [Dehalococcoidia bacterium]